MTTIRNGHWISLASITLLALLTRFCGISYPSETVFDEGHTFRYVSYYLSGEYFFDVHPPLGRFLFVALAKLLGWNGGFIPDDARESYLEKNVPYIPMRTISALFSSATVSLAYLTSWEIGCGIPACLVTAGLLVLDTAHIAHTRTAYLDGPLCFFVIASLYAYIRFSKQTPWTRGWFQWLSLTGLTLSCTISIKMVGVFTYAAIGIFSVYDMWKMFDIRSNKSVDMRSLAKHVFLRLVGFVVIPFLLYLLWFQIHFWMLYRSGTGDGYMSDRFIFTLKNNLYSGNQTAPWAFHKKWWELQRLMLEYNNISGKWGDPHPYATRPYQWPFPTRGVIFWYSDQTREQIFFTGNIPGWWTASGLLLAYLLMLVADQLCVARGISLLDKYRRKHLYKVSGLFFIAWLTHYIPFWFMDRELMLHSYLSAHMISTLLAGSMVELWNDKSHIQKVASAATSVKIDNPPSLHDHVSEKSTATQSSSSAAATNDKTEYYLGSSIQAWQTCWLILIPVFLFWWFWFPLTYGQPSLSVSGTSRREIFMDGLMFSQS